MQKLCVVQLHLKKFTECKTSSVLSQERIEEVKVYRPGQTIMGNQGKVLAGEGNSKYLQIWVKDK